MYRFMIDKLEVKSKKLSAIGHTVWRMRGGFTFAFCLFTLFVPIFLYGTKYAGEFQELGVGARACAMGGVGVAQCVDPSVIYFNPAGTIFSPRSLLLMHAENFAGIVKNEFGSVVLPKGDIAVGVGVQYVSTSGTKFTTLPDTTSPPSSDNPPIPYDTVSTKDIVLYLNGAKATELFTYGANIKLYYRNLAVMTGLGGGLDLGIRLNLKYLKLGGAVRDFILSPIVWGNNSKETISSKISFGVGPEIPLEKVNSIIIIECDIVKSLDIQGFDLNFGFEYAYKDILFGRCGRTAGNYTLGIGLKYKKFNLDYALITHSLENSNKFSAGLEF